MTSKSGHVKNKSMKSDEGAASHHLKLKSEKILSLWEERAINEVAAAKKSASLALRNSLPLYLQHLVEALAANRKMDKSVGIHEKEATRIGDLHGADRAGDKNYDLTEVISEYHILREVIFQVLESDGPLAQSPRDIILDSVEQAVNDAAVKFSEMHTAIQQQFVNTLTHDLKTPITTSKMNAELILKLPDRPDTCISAASRIVASQDRLTAMIHDLLDSTRIRAGEPLSLAFVRSDLNSLIREVVSEMSFSHGDRFTFISNGAVEGLWGFEGLRRAFENLIENAVKYGASQTPITVSLKHDKSCVEINVHNEGPVISESEIPLLFKQYKRSKSAQDATKTGWGIGLTVVKGVVDAHKGKVRVESAEGIGTTFILEIPFAKAAPVVSYHKHTKAA